ncbi:MAG: M24 family metallopeptidase [Bacteroidota bacterium]
MSSIRLQKLRKILDQLDLDAFLITFPPHLRYISGFSGSSGLAVVKKNSAWIFTDGRYTQQIREETLGWKVHIAGGSLFEELKKTSSLLALMRVGIDGNTMMLTEFHQLKKIFPRVKFIPKVDTIEQITAVKDIGEIENIRSAVRITDKVFKDLLPMVKPGVSELDLSAEISYRHRKYGAEGDAFEPIVASGKRSALPHGKASSKKIRKGELLTLDFGCTYNGYHSDMTRTIVVGKPTSEMKDIYDAVLTAQMLAIEAAKDGIKSRDLDGVARYSIKTAGYDKYFRHSLGHGVGLQIHESPRISMQSKAVIEKGNVVTIEPGIYIPQFGGVRIEDILVITNDGSENLTRSPKHLIIV